MSKFKCQQLPLIERDLKEVPFKDELMPKFSLCKYNNDDKELWWECEFHFFKIQCDMMQMQMLGKEKYLGGPRFHFRSSK